MSKAIIISSTVTSAKTELTPELPSTPPIALPPTPAKRVIFTFLEGQWQASVELNDVNKPFTERDFNQLSRLLTVKRNEIRRQSNLAYRALQTKALTVKSEPLSSLPANN